MFMYVYIYECVYLYSIRANLWETLAKDMCIQWCHDIFRVENLWISVLCGGFPGGTGTADSWISVGLGCVFCLRLWLEIRYPKTLADYHHFPIHWMSDKLIFIGDHRIPSETALERSDSPGIPISQWQLRLHHRWPLATAALPPGERGSTIQAGPMWTTPMIGVLFFKSV